MSLPRVVPEGGFQVAGKYLPAGSVIGANPWVLHRNEDVFGEDVHSFKYVYARVQSFPKFHTLVSSTHSPSDVLDPFSQINNLANSYLSFRRPERWLRDEKTVGDMHRFFFAFGAGARMCLGRNISWMEM